MSWSHRLLAHEHKGEIHFQIHEVYYNEDLKPNSYTENPIIVSGEDLRDIKWVLDKMQECTKKPILWYGDRFPQEYNKKIK